jgi:hypothetical protein
LEDLARAEDDEGWHAERERLATFNGIIGCRGIRPELKQAEIE